MCTQHNWMDKQNGSRYDREEDMVNAQDNNNKEKKNLRIESKQGDSLPTMSLPLLFLRILS